MSDHGPIFEERLREALVGTQPEALAPRLARAVEAAVRRAIISLLHEQAQDLCEEEREAWVEEELPRAFDAFIAALGREETSAIGGNDG